jgi:HlyD family secretion protein
MPFPFQVCALSALFAAAALCSCRPAARETVPYETVRPGDAVRTVPVAGEIRSRSLVRLSSSLKGGAVVAYLAEDGETVSPGDVVARFDSTALEQDAARLEGEAARAAAALESLEKAELPLEREALAREVREAERAAAGEAAFAEALEGLASRGLAGESELARAREAAAAAAENVEKIKKKVCLTEKHIHAARLAKARAEALAAEKQLAYTAEQLSNCVVRAPVAGKVSLLSLPMGPEWRPARAGDTVFASQPFLCLPEAGSGYVLEGFLPEAAVGLVVPGQRADVLVAGRSGAFPAAVEQVGGMARSEGGEKRFAVRLALEVPEGATLPEGLGGRGEIVVEEAHGVPTVPRACLFWDGGAHVWRAEEGGGDTRVAVAVGVLGNDRAEIRSPLAAGDRVRRGGRDEP